MRESFLPFSRPTIGEEEINEVVATLKSGWMTTGPKVQQLEQMFQDYTGAAHAVSFNSATAGLHVALLALDLQPDDEVITSAMTFVATYNVIEQAGARVVPIDIDPKTYNMDVNLIEKAITKKTRAIIPVHFTGVSVDLDPIYALAKKYNLRVIEDAAQAVGAEYKGKLLGSFGDVCIYSFHPNKNMTTGEGGLLVTNDAVLARKVNILKFHGIDRDSWNRFSKTGSQEYDVILPGFKYNMLDLQAAIGIHQLPKLQNLNEERGILAERYFKAFKDWKSIQLPGIPAYDHYHTWHLFTIQVLDMNRDDFMNAMKEQNIGTGLHYQAPFLYSYYKNKYGFTADQFPHAAKLGERIVSLPLCPLLTFEEQDEVITAMRKVLKIV